MVVDAEDFQFGEADFPRFAAPDRELRKFYRR